MIIQNDTKSISAEIIGNGIVCRKENTLFGYCGWPSATITSDGRIAVVWSGERAAHICPFGKTCIAFSDQDKIAFADYTVINDTPLDDRDAGITNIGDGKLALTWFTHDASLYETTFFRHICGIGEAAKDALNKLHEWKSLSSSERNGGSYIRISDDDGKTWGKALKLPISAPHGVNVMSNGTIMYLGKGMYTNGVDDGKVGFYTSTDGKEWERIGEVPYPEYVTSDNFHEPYVVELSDGTLFGAIRAQTLDISVYENGYFTVFLTRSNDCGKTWDVPEETRWIGSPPHLLVHSSGALICTVGRRSAPLGIYAYKSLDNGKTWTEQIKVSDIPVTTEDLGYPCTIELKDGSLFTVFYQKYADDIRTSILYSRWRIK